MNKLIERLEGLKSELYKEMVASGYRNDDLEDTVHVVLENALCLVQSMCEAGEVVVPRFKVGDIIGDGEVVCIGIEDGEVYYEMSKPGEIIAGMESTTEYSLTEAEAQAESERLNRLNI